MDSRRQFCPNDCYGAPLCQHENVKVVEQKSQFVYSRGWYDACSAHGTLEMHLNYYAFFGQNNIWNLASISRSICFHVHRLHYRSKDCGRKDFKWKSWIFLFSSDTLNWSKVTVKIFIMIQNIAFSYKCCIMFVWFLKDNVTLKTGVTMLKIDLCICNVISYFYN